MPELHWLGDQDAKRAARRVPYRLLNPVETVGDPQSGNWLIQGDNLEALKALLPGLFARAVGESIFTQASTMDELHALIRDAVRCHFDEGGQPELIRLFC